MLHGNLSYEQTYRDLTTELLYLCQLGCSVVQWSCHYHDCPLFPTSDVYKYDKDNPGLFSLSPCYRKRFKGRWKTNSSHMFPYFCYGCQLERKTWKYFQLFCLTNICRTSAVYIRKWQNCLNVQLVLYWVQHTCSNIITYFLKCTYVTLYSSSIVHVQYK